MIAASKAGLDYYEKNFSPYQFRQFRILEFPRYRTFAQSFPNTVPFSEGIGFIGRVTNPDDIDFTYFVTAHELAHQWWGHQLIGGRVAGSNMMSESLAEYSALRVMQKKYGDYQMHKFLKHELDGYLRGRAGESRKEPPLDLVQREAYVWYQKGSLVLYALSDYIGEDKVNLALHNFLMQYRYANATDSQSGPYPDTRQFVQALREQTPPELQYYITDAFESIVLYDNKAVTATVTPTADKKYKVVPHRPGQEIQGRWPRGRNTDAAQRLHGHRRLHRQEGPRAAALPEEGENHPGEADIRNRRRPDADAGGNRSLQQAHRPHPRRQYDRCDQTVARRQNFGGGPRSR